jgi:hypothetical protein
MIPVASKAIRGLGSSAYSAYKGVRRYLNKPRSYKPRTLLMTKRLLFQHLHYGFIIENTDELKYSWIL